LASQCLGPFELIKYFQESGAPQTVCTLFLNFPVTSPFLRYTSIDYMIQLSKVLVLDLALFLLVYRKNLLWEKLTLLISGSFLFHVLYFLAIPFYMSRYDFSIGLGMFFTLGFCIIGKFIQFDLGKFLKNRLILWTYVFGNIALQWFFDALFSF